MFNFKFFEDDGWSILLNVFNGVDVRLMDCIYYCVIYGIFIVFIGFVNMIIKWGVVWKELDLSMKIYSRYVDVLLEVIEGDG